eukprot:4311664-Karenia_brevis.AAC.1
MTCNVRRGHSWPCITSTLDAIAGMTECGAIAQRHAVWVILGSLASMQLSQRASVGCDGLDVISFSAAISACEK